MAPTSSILWIHPHLDTSPEGQVTSNRPCARLRGLSLGATLRERGLRIRDVSIHRASEWVDDARAGAYQCLVVGKAFKDLSGVAKAVRVRGGKVVVDLCDNVFAPPEDGLLPIYRKLFPECDAVVAATPILAEVARKHVPPRVKVFSITDTYEGPERPAAAWDGQQQLRLLWFGYPNNLPLLLPRLEDLSRLGGAFDVALSVVTLWTPALLKRCPDEVNGMKISKIPWSLEAQERALDACHIVLIPSDDSPARLTKTANRVITSLRAGRYPVAHPLPSYEEFRFAAGLDRDIVRAIQWAVDHPPDVLARITAGQSYLRERFAPSLIATQWEEMLRQTLLQLSQ